MHSLWNKHLYWNIPIRNMIWNSGWSKGGGGRRCTTVKCPQNRTSAIFCLVCALKCTIWSRNFFNPAPNKMLYSPLSNTHDCMITLVWPFVNFVQEILQQYAKCCLRMEFATFYANLSCLYMCKYNQCHWSIHLHHMFQLPQLHLLDTFQRAIWVPFARMGRVLKIHVFNIIYI